MKKIFIIILSFISIFLLFGNQTFANCVYVENSTISSFLNNCKPDNLVGKSSDSFSLEGNGIKDKVLGYLATINVIFGILAVIMLVYAGFLLQFTIASDDKIKKSKDIIKWTLLGIFFMITASTIVYIVINFMFSLGGN